MPIEVRTVIVSYKCAGCKTKYKTFEEALACEQLPIEKKDFNKGDVVKCRHKWQCNRCNKFYPAIGKVVKVIGPEPYNPEYEVGVVGENRSVTHIYYYHVIAPCPKCDKERNLGGVGPNFTLVSRKNKR